MRWSCYFENEKLGAALNLVFVRVDSVKVVILW